MTGVSARAIVFAGGRSTRLGVDKALERLADTTLVDRVIAAARRQGAGHVIVVGPSGVSAAGDEIVREEPQFGGPAAALGAGLAAGVAGADAGVATWTVLLACDLVHPDEVCAALWRWMTEVPDAHLDGAVLVDTAGRQQWLAGCYRTSSLLDAVAGAGLANRSLRSVLGSLRLAVIDASDELVADIDTPADLARARQAHTPKNEGAQ